MKKKIVAIISTLLLTGMLASCNTTNNSSSQDQSSSSTSSVGTSTSSTSVSVDEEYLIRVNAPTGVTYELSKQKAKTGELVTLTITLPSGYSIEKVTMNSTEITAKSANVYEFTMPNRSVTIAITCNVEGEVTLVGDIVAVLEKENDIYVARNVKVEKEGLNYFSFQIKGNDGNLLTLSTKDIDEYRCFANIGSAYNKAYELEIMGGNTYDFFYNPALLHPCYVVRTETNKLPNSATSLYSLFDGMIKSESTINYPGLNRIEYSTMNKEDIDNLKMIDYDMKLYEDNASYALVKNNLESKNYHVYKKFDAEKEILEIVDTYPVSKGNDDRNRYDYNNYGAYSGRWDVVNDAEEGITRTQVREGDALVNVTHGAHYGYYLERDIMDAYRVGFTADEMSSYKIDVISNPTGDNGDFTTIVDSYIEYNSSQGTYTSEIHEAYIFETSISFDKAGKLKELTYTKTKYGKSEWDFSSHKPLLGQEGSIVKTINATYSYGDLYSKSELNFDTTPYFISSIDTIRFYNSKTGMPASDDKSYLHFADKVSLNDLFNQKYSLLDKFVYSPETSLDLWQYGPVASSNEDVIAHQSNDLWYTMSCVGIGSSTVTFTNNTKNTGVTASVEINVNATQKFHGIYLYSTWGGYPGDVTSSTSANVVAGTIQSYKISVVPSSAPVIYTATSENPELLKIVETGEKLTIDTTGATSITTPTVVRVRLNSEWFSDDVTTNYAMFSFTIIPMALNPIGTTWGLEGLQEHAKLEFSDVEDATSTEDNRIYKGTITDDGYVEGGTSLGNCKFDFIYRYVNGTVVAKLTSVYFEKNTDGWSTDPTDYTIEFYYDVASDRFGVYLAEVEYDTDYEGLVYYPIYGNCDDEGNASEFTPFVRLG